MKFKPGSAAPVTLAVNAIQRACLGRLHWCNTRSASSKHQKDRSTLEAPALWIAGKASSLCTLSMRESTTAEGFRALVRSVKTLGVDSHTMSRTNTTPYRPARSTKTTKVSKGNKRTSTAADKAPTLNPLSLCQEP